MAKVVLLDTHILVLREYARVVHRGIQDASRLAGQLGYKLVVHPLSVREIENDQNIPDKTVLLSKIGSYPQLVSPSDPTGDDTFFKLIGKAASKREDSDQRLLYCLYKGEVDLFITEDPEIKKKAGMLRLQPKVLNLEEAVVLFKRPLEGMKAGDDRPAFCFYKNGEKWIVGERGRGRIFGHMKGFEYIRYLLRNEDKDIGPILVYHLGVLPTNTTNGKLSREDRESLSLNQEKPLNSKITAQDREKVKLQLRQLRDEANSGVYSNPEEKMIKEESIEELKRRLAERPIRDPGSLEEKARVNVTRSIKAALKKIHDDPSISCLSKYLNKSTIMTGDTCKYSPIINDKPLWILDPDSANQ